MCFTLTELIKDVIKNCLITHGHPRAILGAVCYAYALNYLLRKERVLEYGELISAVIEGEKCWGASPEGKIPENWLERARDSSGYDYSLEWDSTKIQMLDKLDFLATSLKKGLMLDDKKVLTELECFGKVGGAGDVATLASIYLASRYANNPSLGIKTAAFTMGADTDTIASMTGALLGILNGVNWVPIEWRLVQDYDCLIELSEVLLSKDKRKALEALLPSEMQENNGWVDAPIGKMRLVDTQSIANGKKGKVVIQKWETALGQTLYTKERIATSKKPAKDITGDQTKLFQTTVGYDSDQAGIATGLLKETPGKCLSGKEDKMEFVLDEVVLIKIVNSCGFQNRITIGKVIDIIQKLLSSSASNKEIAKQYKVKEQMVELLKSCLRLQK